MEALIHLGFDYAACFWVASCVFWLSFSRSISSSLRPTISASLQPVSPKRGSRSFIWLPEAKAFSYPSFNWSLVKVPLWWLHSLCRPAQGSLQYITQTFCTHFRFFRAFGQCLPDKQTIGFDCVFWHTAIVVIDAWTTNCVRNVWNDDLPR